MNIGVFDSGLGGLTIFKELIKNLPRYNYTYLGDNARVPYGGRSQEIIYEFTRQAVEFLFKKNATLVILACNTASAAALRRIQQEYVPEQYPDRRVLGVIRPTVETVADSGVKRVGVIGTRATVESKSFVKELKKLNPDLKIWQQTGPLLVPFIEEGELDTPAFKLVLEQYLKPLIKKRLGALILGCTHYELIKSQTECIMGANTKIITEGKIVAEKLKDYLLRHPEIETTLGKKNQRQYYVTDLNERYKTLVRLFLDGYFRETDRLRLVHI